MGGGKGVVRTNEGKRTKRGTKIGGNIIEIVRNRPPNLVFPLAQVRARVKVASRRGLFLPFAWAEVSENNRLSSFFLYFFLLFFFFTGILADTLCPQAITESSSKRNVSEFFLPLFFFFFFLSLLFFFSFFFSSRLSPCKPPGKETESVARVVLHQRGKRYVVKRKDSRRKEREKEMIFRPNLILGIFKGVTELLPVSKEV